MVDGAVGLLACILTPKGVYTNTRDDPQLCEGCHTTVTKKLCSLPHVIPLQQCSLCSCTVSCLAMLHPPAACQFYIKAEVHLFALLTQQNMTSIQQFLLCKTECEWS